MNNNEPIQSTDLINAVITECDYAAGHYDGGDYFPEFISKGRIVMEFAHLGLRYLGNDEEASAVFRFIFETFNELESEDFAPLAAVLEKIRNKCCELLNNTGIRVYHHTDKDFESYIDPIYDWIVERSKQDGEIQATTELFRLAFKSIEAEASARELGEDIAANPPADMEEPVRGLFLQAPEPIALSPFSDGAAIFLQLYQAYWDVECSVVEAGQNVEKLEWFKPALRFCYLLYAEITIKESDDF
ncbi:hypothetical protein [Aneurinibacillus tyrosinisolvens]|uniref:hypothetical protein n=1 Tax=Aneurinibacillus tyrosinisolvens TaxID=1443435 RepID=UPI00063F0B54|nr:hypothetical protein [Aneurinibacillus tyrosinisolvens]